MSEDDDWGGYRKQPFNTMPRITELWAFLSVDPEDGNEGVIGHRTPFGWVPLIAANQERLEKLTPIAEAIATVTGRAVRLARFTTREDVRTITPKGGSTGMTDDKANADLMAWVTTVEGKGDGIVVVTVPGEGAVPLAYQHPQLASKMRGYATQASQMMGRRLRLMRFKCIGMVEEIGG